MSELYGICIVRGRARYAVQHWRLAAITAIAIAVNDRTTDGGPTATVSRRPTTVNGVRTSTHSSHSPPESKERVVSAPSPSATSAATRTINCGSRPDVATTPLHSASSLTISTNRLSSLVLAARTATAPRHVIRSIASLASSNVLTRNRHVPAMHSLTQLLHADPTAISDTCRTLTESNVLHSHKHTKAFMLQRSHARHCSTNSLLTRTPTATPSQPVVSLSGNAPSLSLLPSVHPFLNGLNARGTFIGSCSKPAVLPVLRRVLQHG